MYHPTTRVLTLLEVLQSHRAISGPELAERLEVDVRTVRRYVAMLQDLGIPVESERGRYGRYRLRPGFKLPPLMFNDDEALAITLGLLVTRRMGLGLYPHGIEGALAKVEQVMPDALRARVRAVQDTLVMDQRAAEVRLSSEIVVAFSTAAQQTRRVWMRYRAYGADITERVFDPYGLVYRAGFWYTVGYCHLRHDLRTFRLDRVVEVALRDQIFHPPPDFDTMACVERSIANTPGAWSVDVLLVTKLDRAQNEVPRELANLEETPDGVAMRCYVQSLRWFAHFLMGLECEFVVREPPELREALRALAARALEAAERG